MLAIVVRDALRFSSKSDLMFSLALMGLSWIFGAFVLYKTYQIVKIHKQNL